jgi:hypothetical protein
LGTHQQLQDAAGMAYPVHHMNVQIHRNNDGLLQRVAGLTSGLKSAVALLVLQAGIRSNTTFVDTNR